MRKEILQGNEADLFLIDRSFIQNGLKISIFDQFFDDPFNQSFQMTFGKAEKKERFHYWNTLHWNLQNKFIKTRKNTQKLI